MDYIDIPHDSHQLHEHLTPTRWTSHSKSVGIPHHVGRHLAPCRPASRTKSASISHQLGRHPAPTRSTSRSKSADIPHQVGRHLAACRSVSRSMSVGIPLQVGGPSQPVGGHLSLCPRPFRSESAIPSPTLRIPPPVFPMEDLPGPDMAAPRVTFSALRTNEEGGF